MPRGLAIHIIWHLIHGSFGRVLPLSQPTMLSVRFLCNRTDEAPVGFRTHTGQKSLQRGDNAAPLLQWAHQGELEECCSVGSPDMIMPLIAETGIKYWFRVIFFFTHLVLRQRCDPFFLSWSTGSHSHTSRRGECCGSSCPACSDLNNLNDNNLKTAKSLTKSWFGFDSYRGLPILSNVSDQIFLST